MPYSAYPADSDLIAFLTGVQLWDPILATDVVGYTTAAAARFERLSGRVPFLADPTPVQAYYDPPGSNSKSFQYPFLGGTKTLELDTGFVSIASISLGVSVDNPSGQPVDLQRQCRFKPDNYALKGLPIEAVEFFFPIWGGPNSVMITGQRGYSATIPDDVFNAILAGAAADFVPTLASKLDMGTTGVAEADVRQSFDTDALGKQADRWRQQFEVIVEEYRFIRVGI